MLRILSVLGLVAVLSACGQAKLEGVESASMGGSNSDAASAAPAVQTAPQLAASSQSTSASAAGGELFKAGKDYRVLSRPIPTSNPKKVEIAEFFWYGCSHCYSFEPALNKYKSSAPAFVEVVPVPTMWRDVMAIHAKAYYAAKQLNKPELHEAIFKAMNVEGKRLTSEKAVARLFAEHGVEEAAAMKMLNSFGVNSQVNKARSLAQGAKISGTPTLVVNGKYVVESRLAGSQRRMLEIADYLAKKEKK